MVAEMDIPPNQVMRLVQMNLLQRVLDSETIWLCVSCLTCTTRCPQEVDPAGVIDVARELAANSDHVKSSQYRVYLFQKIFLDNIRKYGRVHEVELIGQFKTFGFLKDFNVPLAMKDSLLAPKLMQRGKFHPFGENVRDRGIVQRIFDRCKPESLPSAATGEESHS
jgi:heterodisulfide reductase subunit C